MSDPDTEGLLKEIDDGPFVALRMLADKARDRGEDTLAAAFDWLVAWRKAPHPILATKWRWSCSRQYHGQCRPADCLSPQAINEMQDNPGLFSAERWWDWHQKSRRYPSLSEAYLAAAKALAETMPMEFLNQRPKAKKGKK